MFEIFLGCVLFVLITCLVILMGSVGVEAIKTKEPLLIVYGIGVISIAVLFAGLVLGGMFGVLP